MKLLSKKAILLGLTLCTFVGATATTYAGTIPRVYLNNNKVFMPQSPFIKEGTTYIPLRSTEQFGFTVNWDAATETVTLVDTVNTVVQKVGSSIATVNGQEIDLGAPAVKKGSTVYVPIRFISNALGGTLEFDSKENLINVDYDINIAEGYGTDIHGRLIKLNTTPLGDTKNLLNYQPVGISEDFYKIPMRYDSGTWLVKLEEGLDFIRPKNVPSHISKFTGTSFAKDEYVGHYIDVLEDYFNLVLNVDYRTIDDNWALAVAATVDIADPTYDSYNDRLKEARKYISYVKKNKIIIEGDFYAEPTTLHNASGYYMRVWMKYKLNKDADIFDDATNTPVKGSVWHEGYADVKLASPIAFGEGEDVRVWIAMPTYLTRP